MPEKAWARVLGASGVEKSENGKNERKVRENQVSEEWTSKNEQNFVICGHIYLIFATSFDIHYKFFDLTTSPLNRKFSLAHVWLQLSWPDSKSGGVAGGKKSGERENWENN